MPNARRSVVAALPADNRAVLVAIKSAFAFCFGFVNAFVFILTKRFCTLMTGNTLALAIQTSKWTSEEMTFTVTLIGMYVVGGATYDAIHIGCDDGGGRALRAAALIIVLSGILADVTEFVTGGCSSEENCSGRHLYFLSPVSFLTGVVTSYLSAHPDGIITNLVTGHMKTLPRSILTYLLRGDSSSLEKGCTSAAIVTVFFSGCLAGSFASGPLRASYAQGQFTPAFTSFACAMAALCYLHFTLCEEFCFNCEVERQLVSEVRKTMRMTRMTARGGKPDRISRAADVRQMMLAAVVETERRMSQVGGGEPDFTPRRTFMMPASEDDDFVENSSQPAQDAGQTQEEKKAVRFL